MWKIRSAETVQRSYLKNLNRFINFSWKRKRERKEKRQLFVFSLGR